MANNIREIITKAIISKGKKTSRNKYTFEINDLTKVLGCWICNHNYEAFFKGDLPSIKGSYDLQIWYSCNNGTDSEIFKTQITYEEVLDVSRSEEREFTTDDAIEAVCDHLPRCVQVDTEGNTVSIEMEKEMGIRIIGDTCIRVEIKEDSEVVVESLDDFEIDENFIT